VCGKRLLDLADLVGEFHGTDSMHASAWTNEEEAAVTVAGSVELEGGLVVQRLDQTRRSGSFGGLNIFMSDPETGEVLLYAFDSFGFPPDPPARGTWHDGELVLLRETSRGQSRTAYRPGADGYSWRKEFRASSEAAWQTLVTGVLTRQDPA